MCLAITYYTVLEIERNPFSSIEIEGLYCDFLKIFFHKDID